MEMGCEESPFGARQSAADVRRRDEVATVWRNAEIDAAKGKKVLKMMGRNVTRIGLKGDGFRAFANETIRSHRSSHVRPRAPAENRTGPNVGVIKSPRLPTQKTCGHAGKNWSTWPTVPSNYSAFSTT